ncbi:ferredoxin--NADP reductase 2 [bacterium BMS3Abin05]|nr:ferredoxin--NADP reductase 2 [bacterium BMS3Abin05]
MDEQTQKDDLYDITIIGAGPIGLYATYYAGLRDMKVKTLESLSQVGGQLNALYPKKYIYDIPGYPKILAEELVWNLQAQAIQYKPEIITEQKVVDLQVREPLSIALTTEKGDKHFTKTVVISAGAGAFMPRKLAVPDAAAMEGRGLYYVVHHPEDFRDRRLLIIGGGDSALDWSLTLEPIAREIAHIHMLKQFRGHEDSVRKLMQSKKIKTYIHHQLKEIHGEEHVEAVTIVNNVDGSEMTFEVDAVLSFIGFITNLGPIKNWGIETERNAIQVDQTMQTNLPGVFAAGDVASHPGKLKLISTGFADAAVAVNNAKHFIEPKARVYPGHSSHKIVKKKKQTESE